MSEIDWINAWNALEASALRSAQEFDSRVEAASHLRLRVISESSRAATMGRFIVDIDRESRRAIVLRQPPRETSGGTTLPRPVPPREAGYDILSAQPGSLDVLLEPYGYLLEAARYEPLQVLSLLCWLLGGGLKIRSVFRHRRGDTPGEVAVDRELAIVDFPGGGRIWLPYGAQLSLHGETPDGVFDLFVEKPTR